MTRVVELRSDTFTLPTESMRRAMAAAEVGDDVWDEDPTIHRLQRRAARMGGEESLALCPQWDNGQPLRPAQPHAARAGSHRRGRQPYLPERGCGCLGRR